MTNVPNADNEEALALHIRRLRQWDGDKQLSQGALAELAGITSRHLRRYESATALLPPVVTLLRIAMALNVTVEELIDQDVLDELRADIEARRFERGLSRPIAGFDGANDA